MFEDEVAYDEDVISVAIMVMVLGSWGINPWHAMASEDVGSTTMHDALEHVTIQPCMQ